MVVYWSTWSHVDNSSRCYYLLFFFFEFFSVNRLIFFSKNVCKKTWTEKEKYKRKCSFWKWGRCTTYRYVHMFTYMNPIGFEIPSIWTTLTINRNFSELFTQVEKQPETLRLRRQAFSSSFAESEKNRCYKRRRRSSEWWWLSFRSQARTCISSEKGEIFHQTKL